MSSFEMMCGSSEIDCVIRVHETFAEFRLLIFRFPRDTKIATQLLAPTTDDGISERLSAI
jgi:hypothetical protein